MNFICVYQVWSKLIEKCPSKIQDGRHKSFFLSFQHQTAVISRASSRSPCLFFSLMYKDSIDSTGLPKAPLYIDILQVYFALKNRPRSLWKVTLLKRDFPPFPIETFHPGENFPQCDCKIRRLIYCHLQP